MADFSFLAEASDIWGEWRFEPWSSGSASGLYRRVSMVKSGLMGEVARYYADDYLVWRYDAEDDAERLRRGAKSESDLLVQRFVFLREAGEYYMKKSSIMFGLRGFVELHFLPCAARFRRPSRTWAIWSTPRCASSAGSGPRASAENSARLKLSGQHRLFYKQFMEVELLCSS